LAGGIRRAALISLFSADDDEMISCKSGAWWELHPQRGRANNSAVLMRHKLTKEYFMDLWKRVEASGAGEPGIYLSNDKEWGTNPCCEIALRPFQFCNLCEVNVSDIESQDDFNARVKAAAFVGTLQAGYTDFHYLRPIWKRTTEKDALIGVSMTGIGSGTVLGYDMKQAARIVKEENARVAEILEINKSARTTTVKPAGTTSLALGTSSGIHAWHNDFYVRRIRVGKNEAIYQYLAIYHPELVEDEYFRPHDTAVISIPQKAPAGAILRTESPIQLLERIKRVHLEWVKPGHRTGSNTHNVSATVSLRAHEWDAVGQWMWENREHYNGLSVLPYDGGSYIQAPFEDCTEEHFNEMMQSLKDIDLSRVVELDDTTNLRGEAACAGGACEIVSA
jgi:ribonucleoside-diphosphate reductase alpha chain